MKSTDELKKYIRGNDTFYALGDILYTEKELDAMDEKTHKEDKEKGYTDRKNHSYDKWYRYNRKDNGKAYDSGVVKCVNEAEKFGMKWSKKDEEGFMMIGIALENQ